MAYYSTNMVVQENEAYVTNSVTKTIVTKANSARNLVTDKNHYDHESEAEDEYY